MTRTRTLEKWSRIRGEINAFQFSSSRSLFLTLAFTNRCALILVRCDGNSLENTHSRAIVFVFKKNDITRLHMLFVFGQSALRFQLYSAAGRYRVISITAYFEPLWQIRQLFVIYSLLDKYILNTVSHVKESEWMIWSGHVKQFHICGALHFTCCLSLNGDESTLLPLKVLFPAYPPRNITQTGESGFVIHSISTCGLARTSHCHCSLKNTYCIVRWGGCKRPLLLQIFHFNLSSGESNYRRNLSSIYSVSASWDPLI